MERSLRAMFAVRSPGERTAAELLKRSQRVASERSLAKVRGPAESAEEPVPWNPADALVDLGGPLDLVTPPFEEALLQIAPSNGPPENCCSGALDGAIVVPGPHEPPAPGVPEPSTWLTMLFGFAMSGLALRRRRRLGRRAFYR